METKLRKRLQNKPKVTCYTCGALIDGRPNSKYCPKCHAKWLKGRNYRGFKKHITRFPKHKVYWDRQFYIRHRIKHPDVEHLKVDGRIWGGYKEAGLYLLEKFRNLRKGSFSLVDVEVNQHCFKYAVNWAHGPVYNLGRSYEKARTELDACGTPGCIVDRGGLVFGSLAAFRAHYVDRGNTRVYY